MKNTLFLLLAALLLLAWYHYASRHNGRPAYVPPPGSPHSDTLPGYVR